ncbi:unnamed protein product [Angiostrongylus costaricensis]|uniref:RING-type E3 ubiquitin transferase n=1 Tax=Angiostrongylus costaricensis TaxID=334426 RepID=A0A0R3PQB1_ANGCS|nr:unnamed protein product [Angiostrongylus costaricensis]
MFLHVKLHYEAELILTAGPAALGSPGLQYGGLYANKHMPRIFFSLTETWWQSVKPPPVPYESPAAYDDVLEVLPRGFLGITRKNF